MKYVVEFYKELDMINLILFWGIVFVTVLLLIFSTIIVRRNRKLKRMIISKEQELEDSRNELAIKSEHINIIENNIIKEKEGIHKEEDNYQTTNKINVTIPKEELVSKTEQEVNVNISEEKEETENPKLNIEELVINYNNEDTNVSIPPIPEKKIEINIEKKEEPKEEVFIPTGPYQKNVLREMSLNQTSPIGIVKKENNYIREMNKAKELNESLINVEIKNDTYENNYKQEMDHSKEMINKIYDSDSSKKEETVTNNNYLEEVSKKLNEAKETDEIKRTEYEIKQEEEAIISYDELMQKKDQLKMIDEEDAVISIDELYNKNKEKERLYNITKEEEDNKFISELKDFRSDL